MTFSLNDLRQHRQALRDAPIPCPFHPDQPASRCRACADEATPPPPPGWRDRAKETP